MPAFCWLVFMCGFGTPVECKFVGFLDNELNYGELDRATFGLAVTVVR